MVCQTRSSIAQSKKDMEIGLIFGIGRISSICGIHFERIVFLGGIIYNVKSGTIVNYRKVLQLNVNVNVLLIKVDIETQTRTVISSGKRPNPSDLGS